MQAQQVWPTGRARTGWLADDLGRDAITHRFTAEELAALRVCVTAARAAKPSLTDVTQADFSHPALDPLFARLSHELKWGPGLVLFTGLPADAYSLEDLKTLFWGVGAHFGDAVSQGVDGDLLGELRVRETRVSIRAKGSAGPLPVHNDRVDLLALFCVRKAMRGGVTRFASALAIAEAIEREHPEYIPILERGFHVDRLGEQPEGEESVTADRIPLFGVAEGLRSFLFTANALLHHQKERVQKPLTEDEEAALAYIGSLVRRPEFTLPILLEPGEMVFVNNYEILHSRTEFENSADFDGTRFLLRLWLEGRPWRPKPASMIVFKNRSGRQGIDAKP